MLVKAYTDVWKPTHTTSYNKDVIITKLVNNQFVMEYKSELDEAMRRNQT